MTESTRARLRGTLVDQYDRLRTSLGRALGNRDLASEALHEMYIKLSDGNELAAVDDPRRYVFRGALNAARNLHAARQRLLDHAEIQSILEHADDAPGPDRIAEARSELAALRKALRELKPRQREVFVAVMYEGVDHETLASRYDVTIRMIQMDLRTAILHCARRTARHNLLPTGALRVSRK